MLLAAISAIVMAGFFFSYHVVERLDTAMHYLTKRIDSKKYSVLLWYEHHSILTQT